MCLDSSMEVIVWILQIPQVKQIERDVEIVKKLQDGNKSIQRTESENS